MCVSVEKSLMEKKIFLRVTVSKTGENHLRRPREKEAKAKSFELYCPPKAN